MGNPLKPQNMTPPASNRLSLYQTVLAAVGDNNPVMSLTKATLVHLSHTLEDIVLTQRLPALIFTGFQESTYWRKETERYEKLATVAKQVCIFAGRALPDDSPAHALQVTLDDDDPVRQEWFLAILSGQFSVVLSGLDQEDVGVVTSESYRRFETIWSFEPHLVAVALDAVEGLLDRYRPQMASELREARTSYPLRPPDAGILSHFTSELIRFEERLNQQLRAAAVSLSESEALLRMVVVSAPVILIATDARGVVTFFDWHGIPQLKRVAEPVVGQQIAHLSDDLPNIDTIHQQALQGNRAQLQTQTPTGISVEIHTAPVRDSDGQVRGAVVVLVDVTEQMMADESRRYQERTLALLEHERELSRTKDRIMRIVSHEFRNPLATISTTADLLDRFSDTLSPVERQMYLRKIQQQVLRLKDMVQDVALILRSSQNALTVELEAVALRTELEDIIAEQREYTSTAHLIRLDYQLDNDTIETDVRILRRIVTNLISNAAKYSPAESPINLNVRPSRGWVLLAVQDYGIGIPRHQLGAIFEPFVRAENIGNASGIGLGMTIIRDSVTALGGTVSIQSTENEGTTVSVLLPRKAPRGG
jgi:signal transduction histidine kinase